MGTQTIGGSFLGRRNSILGLLLPGDRLLLGDNRLELVLGLLPQQLCSCSGRVEVALTRLLARLGGLIIVVLHPEGVQLSFVFFVVQGIRASL